jgi:endo-1,4-beta-xylanase
VLLSVKHLLTRSVSVLTAGIFFGVVALSQTDPAEAQLLAQLPAGSTPTTVLRSTDPTLWGASGAASSVITLAADSGVPATRGLRLTVNAASDPVYNIAFRSIPTAGAVRRNDVLVASLWIRRVDDADANDGLVYGRAELPRSPYTGFFDQAFPVYREWHQIILSDKAGADFPVGDLRMVFHLGFKKQTLEVAGIVMVNLGQNASLTNLPYSRISYPGREANAPWRAEAQRRIEQYRMADLKVEVRDPQGAAVPNASVRVLMRRRAFGVGSFFESYTGGRNAADFEKETAIFERLFNRGTAPIYWADWGWPSRKPQYLATAQWLAERNIVTRGHTMIYPTWQYMPASVRPLSTNPAELQRRFMAQVKEISEATREFGFREYDVTNELRQLTEVVNIVGRDAVADWYVEARRHLPNAKLALNENTILTNGGETEANQQNFLGWYRFLDQKGVAPEVLGFQGHFGMALTSPERVWQILDRFQRETRAELQVTEFDIKTLDEQAQADYTRDFFTACFAHPAITGITMWGFWGENMYVPEGAMYRKDFSPKPNGRAVEELLTKTWWTDQAGNTSTAGIYETKAFLGNLDVIVKVGDQEFRKPVQLPQAGAAQTVVVETVAAANAARVAAIANGASFANGLPGNSWVSIFGSNLGSKTRAWDTSSEIVNGSLPTNLDGVRVEIDGKPMAISFISPGQINFQTPNVSETRDVLLEVITPNGVVSQRLPLIPRQPALFLAGNRKDPAAIRGDGSFVGPTAGGGRPARPGEIISLFGTGFGPTNPVVMAGRVFSGAAALTDTVTIRIGGRPATVLFAGISGAGLYQINVQIPALPTGEHPLEISVAGTSIPAGAVLTVAE